MTLTPLVLFFVVLVLVAVLCGLVYDRGFHAGQLRDEAWQMDVAIEDTIRRTIRAELGAADQPPPFRQVMPLFDQDTDR